MTTGTIIDALYVQENKPQIFTDVRAFDQEGKELISFRTMTSEAIFEEMRAMSQLVRSRQCCWRAGQIQAA